MKYEGHYAIENKNNQGPGIQRVYGFWNRRNCSDYSHSRTI